MCRDEVKKLLAIITSAYPNFKPDNMTMTIDTWTAFLKYDTYEDLQNAVYAYGRTDATGFAPSVGQLLEKARELKQGYAETEGEVWARVYNALADSNYHAKERFDELPKRVQTAIGSFEVLKSWGCCDLSSLEVIKSNFLKAYRVSENREIECTKLPEKYRELLQGTAQRMITGGNQ